MSNRRRTLQPSPPKTPGRRAGRGDFAALVRTNDPAEDRLPLTHISDAYHLRTVLEQGQVATSHCPVFDEPLLYLFYGRPAYRVATANSGSGLDAYWPICLVLKPDAVQPKRVFPFDSGAFDQGRFADYCHKDMVREDFALDADPLSPERLVQMYWQTSRGYFDNRDFRQFEAGPFDFEAKSYAELIRTKANAPFDERHSTIEIQVDRAIALKDNLLAVILPLEFATKDVIARFEAIGALVLPFDTVGRHVAGNMVGQIYEICRDLYGGKHGDFRCW